MVRLRSQRQVHFFRVFPLSSLLLLSFSFFPSSLVSPIWASPCIIRYFPSESTPGSKGKMRKGERRKVERDPFVSSWLSCSRSLFSIFLLSSHHRPQIYAGTSTNDAEHFDSFPVVHFPPSRDIDASRKNASWEPMRIDREKSNDLHAASFTFLRFSRRSTAPC